MKRIALLTLLFPTLLWAADITIGTGGETGVYHTVICGQGLKPRLEQAGHRVTCQTSNGTGQNLQNVLDNKVTAALGQFDNYALRGATDESFADAVLPFGTVGVEALLCAGRKGGRVTSWATLADKEKPEKPYRIEVGPEDSGTAGTWKFLHSKFPTVAANTTLVTSTPFNLETAFSRLRASQRDLVCMVMVPDPSNERIQMVTNDLFFVPIDDPALEQLSIGGNPVYTVLPAPIGGDWMTALTGKTPTVRTIHMSAVLFFNGDKIDRTAQKSLGAVVRAGDLLPDNSPLGFATKKLREAKRLVGMK